MFYKTLATSLRRHFNTVSTFFKASPSSADGQLISSCLLPLSRRVIELVSFHAYQVHVSLSRLFWFFTMSLVRIGTEVLGASADFFSPFFLFFFFFHPLTPLLEVEKDGLNPTLYRSTVALPFPLLPRPPPHWHNPCWRKADAFPVSLAYPFVHRPFEAEARRFCFSPRTLSFPCTPPHRW